MKLSAFVAATMLIALLAIPTEVFAQAVAAAGEVAIVATPATQEAVQDQAWWSGLAAQAITALAGFVTLAIASLAPIIYQFIRSKSKLAAVLLSQAMFDKLVAGINAQIIAEAEKLKVKVGGETLEPETKAAIAHAAQPKIEAAFKETLQHFDKKPGSQSITDMILGRVEAAVAKPGPVKIPAVMERSS